MKLVPVLLLSVQALLLAQSSPTINATSQEVLLDVVVRDKKGKVVRDLTAADFQITDNGAAQTIKSFRLNSGQPGPAGTAPAGNTLDPTRQIRLVTLVFERLGQDGRKLARQAALDLLQTARGPNVYFGVFAVDQRLSALQQYTADEGLLRKAIEKATAGTSSQFHDESQAIQDSLQSMERSSSPAEAQMDRMMLNMLQFAQNMERTQQGRSSIFALLSVVQEQIKLPGRKTVLYFSEGLQLPTGVVEQFHSMIGVANRANVSVYAIDARGLLTTGDAAQGQAMLSDATRQTARQLTALSGGTDFEQSKAMDKAQDSLRANVQNSLEELASSTGGILIANTNDLRGPLRHVAEDIGTNYEIGYTPAIEKMDGSFRKIGVKLARPGLKVQARSGYFALPFVEGQVLLPYEMPLLNALTQTPLPKLVAYRAAALHFGRESEFVLDVPLDQVQFTRDESGKSYRTHLSVLALLKDSSGRVVRKFSQDIPYQGPADKQDLAKQGHFIYRQHTALPEGRYTFETAVLDREAGKVGARKSVYVVAASGEGIRLSSVSLIRRMEPETGARDQTDPMSFDGGKVTPTLFDTLQGGRDAAVSLFFVVYTMVGGEAPELTMEFLREGQVMARATPQLGKADAQGRIPYVATTPLSKLPAGAYEVRLTVKQGGSSAQEHALFTLS